MTTALHRPRLALLVLAALLGLVLAPGGASASSCGMMKAADGQACPPSTACGCCKAGPADEAIRSIPGRDGVAAMPARSQLGVVPGPTSGPCCCEAESEPAAPSPRAARVADDGRPARSGSPLTELAEPRPAASPTRPDPAQSAGPPRVPLYLRDARLLI